MSLPRYAAIDNGTNSTRLLIGDGTTTFERHMQITRLGAGVDATGRLSAEGIARVTECLRGYREIMDRYDLAGVRMTATSAARDAANRDDFAKAPDKYAPQFGGYCAWAVAHNYTAGIDPEAWRIVDCKLYLNYSKDVQKKWEADIPGFIKAGTENWPKLKK